MGYQLRYPMSTNEAPPSGAYFDDLEVVRKLARDAAKQEDAPVHIVDEKGAVIESFPASLRGDSD